MSFEKYCSSLLIAAVLFGASATLSFGQQRGVPAAAPAASQPAKAAPLSEDELRSRYVGKMVFLRGLYEGDNIEFDEHGKVNGSPAQGSFTLSALQVRKVNLTKHKLEIEADRYALHFLGALPYEDTSQQPYDKVKISKKPVHISIQRELVVIPKVKKQKKNKNGDRGKPALPALQSAHAAGSAAVPSETASAPAAPAAPVSAPVSAPGTTTSPAHSAMLMNSALDKIFAFGIDDRMIAQLPGYWQEYFKSRQQHREFMPAGVQVAGGDVTPPKMLNSIDPSSNEYAQKYGITGLTLFRTVVDASGKPQQIAVVRPIGFGLDEKAVQAIKESHFTPATSHGHAVPVVIDVVVTFRIFSNRTKPGSVPKGAKPPEVAASAWDTGKTIPAKAIQ